MVTMTINFNKEKLLERELTIEELLKPFDEHCIKHQISKPEIHIFEKEGKHALALIGLIMCKIAKNERLLEVIDTWYWDVDGKYEDLLTGVQRWKNKY